MHATSEHLEHIKPHFPELKLKGLYLSPRHTLEMASPGEDALNFGIYPLTATDMTGHNYLALRPLPGRSVEDWPVMLYGEQEGQGRIFAASYRSWFPSFLIGNAGVIKKLPEIQDEVLAYGAQFDAEATAAVIDILLRDGKKADPAALYAISEPGSYLAEFHALAAAETDAERWATYRAAHPHDNKAFRHLLQQEMTVDLAWELFERNLRYDFHNGATLSRLLHRTGHFIAAHAPRPDSPFMPMIERIAACDSAYDDWDGGSGFFAAGEAFSAAGEYARALTCYENALYLHGMDTEELHEDAYHAAFAAAEKLADPGLTALVAWMREVSKV